MTFVLVLLFSLPLAVSSQEETIELLFRQNDPPDQVGGLFAAIDAWNAAHPNVQVRYETVPWADAQNQYVREVQSGGGPDIAQMAFVWTRDLAENGLVTNLDQLIESTPPGAGIDDFLGTELAELDGSLYGIPWTVDTFVMPYRPDHFEAAGIEAFPDTWDEFFAAAQSLTQDTDGDGRTDQYGFCFPAGTGATSGLWFLINYYLWSHGKFFVEQTEDGSSWQVGVTAEDVDQAMQYYNQFFTEGVTPESLIAITSWGDPELVGGLTRGDCSISFFPPATFRAAKAQAPDVTLATGPIPRGPETRISHLGGRTLVINPNSQHPEEAWEFLTYLASAETFETYAEFPAQESLLAELEFAEGEEGYVEQLPHAITFYPYISSPLTVTFMADAATREFGAVFSGQKTTTQAAADLVAAIDEELQRVLAE
jgi:multiple sugar transport system substrate-binding protein